MYTLVSAYGQATAMDSAWGPATPAALTMTALFAQYRHLYLTLTSSYLVDPIHVDFEVFRSEYGNSSDTLTEVLDAIPNQALATIPEIPSYVTQRVSYIDAFQGQYQVEISAPGADPSSVVFASDRTEVQLHRPRTNMQGVFDNCLFTVNGFFYPTATDGNKIFIPDGTKSLFKSRQNHIGLLNFQKIGKVKQIPITAEMVYKQKAESFHSRRAFIDIGETTQGKTVLAVIGGYLYIPGPAFQQHSDQLFNLNFNHVPLLQRYFESAAYLDFSSLGLGPYPKNPSQINVAEFFSDPVFLKYLTHRNSFFVVVDAENLFFQRHYIKHSHLPGRYKAYREPKYPLVTSNGRMPEYWKQYQDGEWAVDIADANLHNRVALHSNPEDIVTMTDASGPWPVYYDSRGYFLEIGSQIRQP